MRKTMSKKNINIVFDGGGSAVLWTKTYAHMYDDGSQIADDVQDLLSGGSTDDWDGNEIDILDCEVGQYDRCYSLTTISELLKKSRIELDYEDEDDDYPIARIKWDNSIQLGSGTTENEFWAKLLEQRGEKNGQK
jgi:hypothetical protein